MLPYQLERQLGNENHFFKNLQAKVFHLSTSIKIISKAHNGHHTNEVLITKHPNKLENDNFDQNVKVKHQGLQMKYNDLNKCIYIYL